MREVIERGDGIGTVSRKRRQIVCAREDVHGIDLDGAQTRRGRAYVRGAGAGRLLRAKPQRGQGETARLGGREVSRLLGRHRRCSRKNSHIRLVASMPRLGRPAQPFGQRRAAGPVVASAVDRIEHHRRIVRASRVGAPRDVRRHGGVDRLRRAAVASRPVGRPHGDVRKRPGGRSRSAAGVRSNRIGRPMERNHRHRSRVRAPVPRQQLRGRHHADGRDPIEERARQDERHPAAVGQPVGVNPRRIDVVVGAQLVDQVRDERDVFARAPLPQAASARVRRRRRPTDRRR